MNKLQESEDVSSFRGNYIFLNLKLDTINNFLKHVAKETHKEINDICVKNEEGKFLDSDDYENVLYFPMSRQEIASRAVYYELNALVESELQYSAWTPWIESKKYQGSKSLDLNNLTSESIKSLKQISDLRLNDILKLIENKFKIRIEDLEGSDFIYKIREIVNSYKHRGGVIDFRRTALKRFVFPQVHKIEMDDAFQAIEQTNLFIRALWKATNREPHPLNSSFIF